MIFSEACCPEYSRCSGVNSKEEGSVMGRYVKSNQSGLYSVAVVMKLLGGQVELGQLNHMFSALDGTAEVSDLAMVFKRYGYRSKILDHSKVDFSRTAFPLICRGDDGGYMVLAKYDQDQEKVLVQSVSSPRATWVAVEGLKTAMIGEVLAVANVSLNADRPGSFGFSWFLKNALKYRTILYECAIASLFVQVFALSSPLVFMIVIDKVLTNNSLSTLDVLVLALVVVSIFEIILNSLRSYLLSHTACRLDLMLGVSVFRHLMSLPLSYYESRQVGDTIARMRELETVRQFITGAGIMLFLDLLFVVVFLTVMSLFSSVLTFIVAAALPFLFCVSLFISPLLRDKLENSYTTNAENQSFLVETIAGIETVKSSAAEPDMQNRWERKLARHVKTSFQSGQLANLVHQSTAVVSKVLSVLLLWFGAKEVLAGNLTVGQLIAFNMLSSRVIAPVLRLSQVWKEFQQVKVAIARIADIFHCLPEPGFDPRKTPLPAIDGAVEFARVSFRYAADGAEVLRDVSFTVKPGEVVGIVGSSGSGKTTLAKLLQRLYVPERGRVFVDGIDLAMADAGWLRRQMGVVPQDGVLLNGSIRDNIALNNPDIEVEDLQKSARLAGAHSFIMQLQQGYDTPVGERGVQLSAGQRQRLAIARALAANPRMLILDEATAALDYESEMIIQENMREICAGRTVFIIAHRLTSVRHADRIITLENGVLVENDTPRALLEAGGRYAGFHKLQEGCHA